MKRESHKPEHDIAQQSYRGPSKASAMAGEGFIAHFQWAGIGLLLGTAVGLVLYGPLKPAIAGLRNFANKFAAHEGKTVEGFAHRGIGKFVTGIFGTGKINTSAGKADEALQHWQHDREHGFGIWLFNHTFGLIPGVRDLPEKLAGDRGNLAVTFSGIFAFVGYVIIPLCLAPFGWKKGNEGKRQF